LPIIAQSTVRINVDSTTPTETDQPSFNSKVLKLFLSSKSKS